MNDLTEQLLEEIQNGNSRYELKEETGKGRDFEDVLGALGELQSQGFITFVEKVGSSSGQLFVEWVHIIKVNP